MPATRTSKASSSSKASRDPSTEPPPTASSSKDVDEVNDDGTTLAAPSVKERSRNAKAQARHREKRKAYIEHLEKTVTALKAQLASMGISSPSPSILASPADAAANEARLRALQEENERLKREIRSLRDRLDAMSSSSRGGSAYPPHGHNISMSEDSMARRRSFDEGGAGGPGGSYMSSLPPLRSSRFWPPPPPAPSSSTR